MTICVYCNKGFKARAQTKKPKACLNRDCQRQRQRENEKQWRKRQQGGAERYFQLARQKRITRLKEWAKRLAELMQLGARFRGEDNLSFESVEQLLFKKFMQLGIRQVNKLWGG